MANLTPAEALKQARDTLNGTRFDLGGIAELDRSNLRISPKQIQFSALPAPGVSPKPTILQTRDNDPATIMVKRTSQQGAGQNVEHLVSVLGHPGWDIYWINREADAVKFADALFALVRYARGAPRPVDQAAESSFAEAAARYRAASTKPEFPEAARRFRVRAEVAIRDKELEEAADLYHEALRIAPWWPEGRFNLALILGELKEYSEAMAEMKRYLALVPDAPNARAAQDKIYEWEGRAGRK